MTAEMVMSVAAIIGVIVSIYVAWRKTPAEKKGLEAEAAEKWEQIAARSAERIAALEKKMVEVEVEVQSLREENERLQEWAERLAHQVQSLGVEPVKMKMQRQR